MKSFVKYGGISTGLVLGFAVGIASYREEKGQKTAYPQSSLPEETIYEAFTQRRILEETSTSLPESKDLVTAEATKKENLEDLYI